MINKLIIAAAGSGKTTYLVKEALERKDSVLITTYTRSNEEEIRNKIISEKGYIPSNIEIQTWVEFLLIHGVRPFQGVMHDFLYEKNIGFFLVNNISTKGIAENNVIKYFFNRKLQIYSDKISNFIIKCDNKSNGWVFTRIQNIYSHIFIDEVQDFVGYDLDILKKLIYSTSELIMAGDPRQTTYATHSAVKYKKYKNGKITDFIFAEINKKEEICKIDTETLNLSHRNNDIICSYSSLLFQSLPKTVACTCDLCRSYEHNHIGVFLLSERHLTNYLEKYNPVQLRWDRKKKHNPNYLVYNFGESKGLSFDRVIIYPTEKIKSWIKNNSIYINDETRAKFYVAITRARKSVAIVIDNDLNNNIVYNNCSIYDPK